MIENVLYYYDLWIKFFQYSPFFIKFFNYILYFLIAFMVVLYFWEFEDKLTTLFHKNYFFNFVSGVFLFKPIIIFFRSLVKGCRLKIEVRSKVLYYVIPVFAFSVSISTFIFLLLSSFMEDIYIISILLFAMFTTLFLKLLQIIASFNSLNSSMGLVFRILFQIISFLPVFMVHFLTITVIFKANTFSSLPQFGGDIYSNLIFIITAILFFMLMMIMTSKSPFDIVSTRSMKITDEMGYSGVLLLFMELVDTTNLLIWSTVFSLLFLGGATSFLFISPIFFLFLKIFFVYFAIIKISLMLGNYSIHKIVSFSWFGILPFSLIWLLLDIYFYGIA